MDGEPLLLVCDSGNSRVVKCTIRGEVISYIGVFPHFLLLCIATRWLDCLS